MKKAFKIFPLCSLCKFKITIKTSFWSCKGVDFNLKSHFFFLNWYEYLIQLPYFNLVIDWSNVIFWSNVKVFIWNSPKHKSCRPHVPYIWQSLPFSFLIYFLYKACGTCVWHRTTMARNVIAHDCFV